MNGLVSGTGQYEFSCIGLLIVLNGLLYCMHKKCEVLLIIHNNVLKKLQKLGVWQTLDIGLGLKRHKIGYGWLYRFIKL